ncbi:RnfH family protein [Comamonas sp. NLF-1-9]|uniref:RnfH family protein n=1 Tax=Comamonas sp. NLF-1-9 TaxID=2853163 RepID=UPI001C439488|nr:RnfH family protein [Comamonas sp. NLF-1-9]QXL85236.1 RnfH family protein [Comamonas sp. NLF-1-9]
MAEATIRVVVVTSAAPRQTQSWTLDLPAGATLAEALRACGLQPGDPDYAAGVWGRAQPLDTPLREGDRIDWCRPLRVDPKVARRERFARQGARTAGLFAQRR